MSKKTKLLELFVVLGLQALLFSQVHAQANGGLFIQRGKVSLSTSYPCGHVCDSVVYPNSFPGQADVQVQATVEGHSPTGHGGVAVWVSSVTTQGFRVCILRTGRHVNNTVEVNWFATGSNNLMGVLRGAVVFNTWTTGTRCENIHTTYNMSLISEKLPVFVTARHQATDQVEDAASVWIEDINRSLKVCMREMRNFEGPHKNIAAEWIIFLNNPPSRKITEVGEIIFKNVNQPKENQNYAYCQKVNFTDPHYSSPVVIATANHAQYLPNAISPQNNAINVWTVNITTVDVEFCVKDLVEKGGAHDPIEVDFAVVGDLDPCINVTCDYHAICQAFGPKDARCVCVTMCPSVIHTVCASNGQTFDNECLMELAICTNKSDFTMIHPGNCLGFPYQRGFYEMKRLSQSSEYQCDIISFRLYTFYRHKKVHVQVTVSHVNHTSNQIHDASASWVENVNENNFTVCVMLAGRNRELKDPISSVDWFAYQDSPPEGVIGSVNMKSWWSGTSCETVKFPQNTFSSAPTVLATADHTRLQKQRDAASVWLEDITASDFKVCLREMQNFDGSHNDIYVNWIAFEEIPRPYFREHNSVTITLNYPPSDEDNAAQCQDVSFSENYGDTPTVLVTAAHSTNGGNKVDPASNAISAWIENVNKTGFQTCVKELYVKKYDPVSVQYAVLADICKDEGWQYFRGFCYFTHPQCTDWNNASVSCQAAGSYLVSVQDQEENVYIQHLHGGEKSWIGLTDAQNEGTFLWSDNSSSNFTFWAHGQPNNLNNEDCVHIVGAKHQYQWNDVSCKDCHSYTCKKDFDECSTENPCKNGGQCVNTIGGYSCTCASGFTGQHCETVINGCSLSPCQNGGTCHNIQGNFTCMCAAPYSGTTCTENVTVSSCKEIKQLNSTANSGIYSIVNSTTVFQVFCDMTDNSGGWTLISRFSNSDGKNWMQVSGNWWYDKSTASGSTTNTSSNSDMISSAFWKVTGSEIKLTRSDDSSNTALLRTYGSCVGGRTFRSFITRYGNFRNGAVWASDSCRGSCYVYYGGQYSSTSGFKYHSCSSSDLQYSNRIGFWCDWSTGDGSVMMIGGGGDNCNRADHGVGITEENEASFKGTTGHQDFGDDADAYPVLSYSLNLWIR